VRDKFEFARDASLSRLELSCPTDGTGLKTNGVVPVPMKNACLQRPESSGNSGSIRPPRRPVPACPMAAIAKEFAGVEAATATSCQSSAKEPSAISRTAGARPYFFSLGRKTRNGRLIVPAHARVKLLPPSVQVCVPLRSACRRTNAPLYFASY
jgi:hypothetical protein